MDDRGRIDVVRRWIERCDRCPASIEQGAGAAGVPAGEREELLQTVAALPADVSVLLIEHDMDLVFSFASRMTVLVNGAVLTEGDRTSVFVVTGQNVVQRRPVRRGPAYEGLRSVEGLQAEEWVVIDQLQRLGEGAKVVAEREPPPGP